MLSLYVPDEYICTVCIRILTVIQLLRLYEYILVCTSRSIRAELVLLYTKHIKQENTIRYNKCRKQCLFIVFG